MVEASSNGEAMQVDQQVDSGIHASDGTTVKQYFNYYAKLANQ